MGHYARRAAHEQRSAAYYHQRSLEAIDAGQLRRAHDFQERRKGAARRARSYLLKISREGDR